MFEKSLYDLIRGLRNHKGNERAYIQGSLRECRREIKSQDMDLKATALLKLTYLEMFGHDMSWASFNVLEVMSSQKYVQKRVGYLAAVQSFRPDTEVLMLAENLLKKDLASSMPPTISLPLVAIPHVISAPMANALLTDLLPRLSHSHPAIRKKTIVTLYRLALVFPETLRPAWPRMKERLQDEDEDPTVTAAVVNVVCELGWRRPADFLPLAPRLFDLLVEGTNNWMAIKIIKLFATLTPLEPRLTKKLLPPLTTIIKTTPAMSLLYECINGVISAGILDSASGTTEGDEIARLCISKLRGMLVVEGDPNLRYVALLAFNRVVESHPYLVSLQEDVILECIDDPDVSIRLRALDLVVGMVNAQNLTTVVERLLKQLRNSPLASPADDPDNDRAAADGIEPEADADDEEPQRAIKEDSRSPKTPSLPDDYRISIIQKILSMCSLNTYANIDDFSWYLEVLLSLVRHVPATSATSTSYASLADDKNDVAHDIGSELRNVAIRVKSSRREAVQAADALVSVSKKTQLFPPAGTGAQAVLEPAVWIVGEFAALLEDPRSTLTSLIHPDSTQLPAHILSAYIQASMKVLSQIVSDDQTLWTAEQRTMTMLLLARVSHFLESLASHPDLETQELAVQYLELARLSNEAARAQSTEPSPEDGTHPSAPLLLTQALPSLFMGGELKPIAPDAQHKVPLPPELDLDAAINPHLTTLLQIPQHAEATADAEPEDPAFHAYYYVRPVRKTVITPAADRLVAPDDGSAYSYQNAPPVPAADKLDADPAVLARRRAARLDRQRDDPFYIAGASAPGSGTATPMHDILQAANGDELDVDSIPVMALDLDAPSDSGLAPAKKPTKKTRPKTAVEILGDESLGDTDDNSRPGSRSASKKPTAAAARKNVLQVDSSGLDALSLADESLSTGRRQTQLDVERREAEQAEMAAAMREVERLRLEMQRAQERVEARDGEVTVKKKKGVKKKARAADIEGASAAGGGGEDHDGAADEDDPKPKKSKKKAAADGADGGTVAKKKKKKKPREATFDGDA